MGAGQTVQYCNMCSGKYCSDFTTLRQPLFVHIRDMNLYYCIIEWCIMAKNIIIVLIVVLNLAHLFPSTEKREWSNTVPVLKALCLMVDVSKEGTCQHVQ